MDWSSFVAGIIATAVVIPLIQWIGRKFLEHVGSTVDVIEIVNRVENLEYGMLHIIRHGLPERQGSGKAVEVRCFLAGDRVRARVRHPKHSEFEFKCFVDYGDLDFNDVARMLHDAGMNEVTQGAGKKSRAWFLLPNYEVVQSGPNRNNLYYPS